MTDELVIWNVECRRRRRRRRAAYWAGIGAQQMVPQADLMVERARRDAPTVQRLWLPLAVDLPWLCERLQADGAL